MGLQPAQTSEFQRSRMRSKKPSMYPFSFSRGHCHSDKIHSLSTLRLLYDVKTKCNLIDFTVYNGLRYVKEITPR